MSVCQLRPPARVEPPFGLLQQRERGRDARLFLPHGFRLQAHDRPESACPTAAGVEQFRDLVEREAEVAQDAYLVETRQILATEGPPAAGAPLRPDQSFLAVEAQRFRR